MAFAPGFDKHLRRALENKLPAYKCIAGCRAEDIDRGKGTAIQERATRERANQRWMVDVAGLPKKKGAPVVLVEVELKKDNPVENVVKIWRWATERKYTGRVLFLQAFSAHYWTTKVKQRVRSEFIGKQMMADRKLDISYRLLRILRVPRDTVSKSKRAVRSSRMLFSPQTGKGGGAMVRAAKRLALTIAKSIHSV